MGEKIYYENNLVGEDAILSFSGKYFFLSNFSRYSVEYDGIIYPSSEAAFQAQKTLDKDERLKFLELEPSQCKHLGKRVKLREDWKEVKDNIMYEIVKSKFDKNPDIREELLNTEDRELYEGNMWHDKYWGVVREDNKLVGKNKLGKILMRVREEYNTKK